MEKQFVPYELSVKLKELGFDEECFAWYDSNSFDTIELEFEYKNNKDLYFKESCTAPLYQQALDWFREKYNIVSTIYSNASGYIYELHYDTTRGGTHILDSGETGDCPYSGMFTTYEKARLELLKKLIELCNH